VFASAVMAPVATCAWTLADRVRSIADRQMRSPDSREGFQVGHANDLVRH
jgi:hypothetical protein